MRALVQILILFSLVAQAQITSIIPNVKLGEEGVDVSLNTTQDTLIIRADAGDINKVSIIKRVSPDRSVRTAPIVANGVNLYYIPLYNYRVGAYTVEVHYKPHIYPFKMFRVRHIPYDMNFNKKILGFRAVCGVVSAFSSHTVRINALTKSKMDDLILKFETDKNTVTGYQNWLKIYAKYEDNTEGIYYEVKQNPDQ